jgi:hypothetical protein
VWNANTEWTAAEKFIRLDTDEILNLPGTSVEIGRITAIPEPTTGLLLTAAGLAFAFSRRFRTKQP